MGNGEVISANAEGVQVKFPVERSAVRFICMKQCPKDLPSAEAAEDTLHWNDGSRTAGRITVQCEGGKCRYHQDGKPAGADFPQNYGFISDQVRYVEFGRPTPR